MKTPLLEMENLQKRYPVYSPLRKLFPPRTYTRAVSSICLALYGGETYDLVGESGYGRNTTRQSVLGLVKPDSGEILYKGQDLARLSDSEFHPLCRDLQMVFQGTLSPLNPRPRVGALPGEPLIVQGMKDGEERRQEVMETLGMVESSGDYYFRYPHELSDGQVQRLGIARTLTIDPKLIICDKPVSALDVSTQSQVLGMLTSLQREMNLSLLFIPHNTGTMRYISNRIGTMYLGTLVEEASTDELFSYPPHPYTQASFASIPDFSKKKTVSLKGKLPTCIDEFKRYTFRTHYPYACDQCRRSAPELGETRPGYRVARHQTGGIVMK